MHPVIYLQLPWGLSFQLKAYTLFAAIAALAAFVILLLTIKRKGFKEIEIVILSVITACFFLAGARLLNYTLNFEEYMQDGRKLFDLHFGCFSLNGGMLLGAAAAVGVARLLKKDIWLIADSLTLPFLAAFAVMRIGCFLNGCCYGKVCSYWFGVPAPLAKVNMINTFNKLIPGLSVPVQNVYPTQLMEMIGALVFFPIALRINKQHAGKGYAACLTISWFAVFRFAVLPLRDLPYADYIINIVYPVFYAFLFVFGLSVFLIRRRIHRLKGL